MYEISNLQLNHHENKIKVLLKYILFFLDMRKMSGCVVTCLKLQPWSCSEQVRADSEQNLQEAAAMKCFLGGLAIYVSVQIL